jgi:uncharacterized protein (DUF488 family)
MKVYTIGFTKKTAEEFFNLLIKNDIKLVIDTRLNNVSQLSGYAKGIDLKYFLEKIAGIEYIHELLMAPNDEILQAYRKKEITWKEYEIKYIELLESRKLVDLVRNSYLEKLDHACILCSEDVPDKCHRRLLVDYLKKELTELNIDVKHLV